MTNVLLQPVDYQITKTAKGTWKKYLYPSGMLFREYVSDARWGDRPMVHVVLGRSPETGTTPTARGFIAVGQKAVGVIAIGHAALGWVAVGQAAFGYVFAVGQVAAAPVAVAQVVIGAAALGQIAAAVVGAAQIGLLYIGAAQLGTGRFLLTMVN